MTPATGRTEFTLATVERAETVNLNEVFQRMTGPELEAYAKDGTLPAWFQGAPGATPTDSREGSDAS